MIQTGFESRVKIQQIIDNQMSLSEYPIHIEARDFVDGVPETKEVEVKLNKQIPQGVFVSTEGSDLMNFHNGKTDEAFESKKRSDQSDEFLVEKKNPLTMPPDFEKLPTPGDEEVVLEENRNSLNE